MIKQSAGTNDIYKRRRENLSSLFRVLKVQDVGIAFEQAINADDNGGVFIVFPDVPIVKLPELNKIFMIPLLTFANILILISPYWKRLNGSYLLWILILFIFMILHLFISIIL